VVLRASLRVIAMVWRAHFWFYTQGRVRLSIDEPMVCWVREHGTLHVPDVRAQNDFPMLGVVGNFRTFWPLPSSAGELMER